MGRWDRGYSAAADGAEEHLTRPPSEWLRQLWFDTVLHSPASLRFLVDVVGVEHVVLGSDYPFRMGDPDPVATVRAVGGLAGKDLERVLSGNLATLLEEVRR
jgi:aminocarboxymuconate-semialdehyde decarboxylase